MRAVHVLLLRAVVLGVLVAGCSGGSSAPTATPTTRPATPTTPTIAVPSPTSIRYGEAVLVQGSLTYSLDEGTITTDAAGHRHSRGGSTQVTLTCSDPRVTASGTETWESDQFGEGPANGALVQWGDSRFSNAAGGWVGHYTGIASTATQDTITWWMTGTGGYQGLSLYLWATEADWGHWQGLIYPGGLPPMTRSTGG